jgi:hypothetical protein
MGCETKPDEPAPAKTSTAASAAPSVDAAAICKKAASRYIGCMEELLGKEAGELAKQKQDEGIPACIKDQMTVAMYRKCLPMKDCPAFQKCISDFAKTTDPKRPNTK